MLLLLLCFFANAQEGTATPSADQIAIASELATVDTLVAEARRRLVVGDYEGATITAREALAQPGPHQSLATYLLAMSLDGMSDTCRTTAREGRCVRGANASARSNGDAVPRNIARLAGERWQGRKGIGLMLA